MKPTYISLTFDTAGFDSEIWMAMLGEWPFESFHEEEDRVIGYIPLENVTAAFFDWMIVQRGIRYRDYVLEHVAEQNWNAVWESSFNPVAVEKYCYIKANFHAPGPPGFKHEIVIAPRMAFGTGHHATTYMMLDAMSHMDFRGKNVFDFGCGTGILSVVAAKEGAASVTGIDIQPEAIENSIEHAAMNQVSLQCEFILGELDQVEGQTFDIILANINTHVIAKHMAILKLMLRPGGYMLLSGIMDVDKDYVNKHIDFSPLQLLGQQGRQDWVQMTLQKPATD